MESMKMARKTVSERMKPMSEPLTTDESLFFLSESSDSSQSLTERANEIISEALFNGTLTFNGNSTKLKPETILNLAKTLRSSTEKKKEETSSLPEDFYTHDSLTPVEEVLVKDYLTMENEDTQLEFPFMKHEGK